MLVNVPLGDQRTEVGADGRAPEDGNMDCVPESLAKMAQALTGRAITGDELHDAVYGQGYVGMQDPARFVGILHDRYGVTLTAYTGTPGNLLTHAVACLLAHEPVLLSIPSDWDNNPPHSGYAHMVAACDVPDANDLTAMNPWGTAANGYQRAAYQTQSLAWWQERLATCAYKATWVMTRNGGSGMAGVPAGWHDDGATLTAPNGRHVVRGFRAFILSGNVSWDAAVQPVGDEYGVTGGTQQDFQATVRLHWDAASNVTSGAGPDYAAIAQQQQARADAAQVQVSQLTAQLAAANEEIAKLKAAAGTGGGTPAAPTAADIAAATVAALAAKLSA